MHTETQAQEDAFPLIIIITHCSLFLVNKQNYCFWGTENPRISYN